MYSFIHWLFTLHILKIYMYSFAAQQVFADLEFITDKMHALEWHLQIFGYIMIVDRLYFKMFLFFFNFYYILF